MDQSRKRDFYKVHCAMNRAAWCFCVAWWVPTWDDFSQRQAMQNYQFRDRLFERGEYDGYLLYIDGRPVGWSQVGPRDRLEKLTREYELAADPHVWAITCFLIAPPYRRLGMAEFMLNEIIADLRLRGARRVEAFPHRGEALSECDMWTGPEVIFRRAGFRTVRDDPEKPVLALDL
jgi:GNAT superfamily N-acetyltransferase